MSNPIAKALNERRLRVYEEAKELVDRAAAENRDFSGEEQEKWNRLNGEIDAIDARIKGVMEAEQRAADVAKSFEKFTGPKKSEGDMGEQVRAFARGETRALHIPHLGLSEYRDQTKSNASGLVPVGFRNQLWEYMIETSGVLNTGVDMLETASGETIYLPRVTAHSTASSVAEAAAITESDPTFSKVDSTVSKEGYLVQLSRELVEDSGVDIQGYLARAAGRELGNRIGSAAVTAALAAASAGVTGPAGTATSFGTQSTAGQGFDLLIDTFYSVIDPYRKSPSCAWLMSDVTASKVRKLKSADGVYAWQPSVVAGQPDTILSKPVYIDTNVPDPAANAESILFGDWRSLVVRIAGGIRFERSDDYAFGNDLVSYRALVRHGSVSVDANALKSFTHGAS